MIKDLVHADPVQDGAPNGQLTAQQVEALKTDYAEAIEIIRAFHGRVRIDGTSLRLGAPSPNSTMGRAAALLARAALASPNDEGKADG